MRRSLILAATAAASLVPATPAVSEPSWQRDLERAGLVRVVDRAPGIRLDLRYATARNFTGRRLPGYCRAEAFLLERPARALGRVQRRLARAGLGLRVFDGYRPARATRSMVRWAQRTGNEHVLREGYIARRSNHNRGAAVDLTLVGLESGRALDMGTPYDTFSTRAHTENASGRPLRNRLRLRAAMQAEGYVNYRREWWHYDFPAPAAGRLDLPLGC